MIRRWPQGGEAVGVGMLVVRHERRAWPALGRGRGAKGVGGERHGCAWWSGTEPGEAGAKRRAHRCRGLVGLNHRRGD